MLLSCQKTCLDQRNIFDKACAIDDLRFIFVVSHRTLYSDLSTKLTFYRIRRILNSRTNGDTVLPYGHKYCLYLNSSYSLCFEEMLIVPYAISYEQANQQML